MYGRKIKVLKKKTKTSGVKSNDRGSNWGPRIALYEREREASQYQVLQKQQIQPSSKHHQASSTSSASVSNQSSHSATYAIHSTHNPNNNNNNSHYSGSRHSSNHPNNGSINEELEPRTVSPESSIATSSHRAGSALTLVSHYGGSILQNPHQQHEFSISSRKLSSNNPNNNDNLSKPLTVIIPPPDRFPLGSDFGPEIDSSLPSTKTWKSSPDHERRGRGDMSGGLGLGLEDSTTPAKGSNLKMKGKAPIPGNSNGTNGPIPVIHRLSPVPSTSASSASTSGLNPHKEEENYYVHRHVLMSHPSNSKSTNESHMNKMQKSKLRKDFQGANDGLMTIGMVYVPMEAYSNLRSSPTRVDSRSPEQQAVDNLNDMIDGKCGDVYSSTSVCSTDDGEQFSNSHQFSLVPQLPSRKEAKDPDVDSLLESFDSIMFKPKSVLKSHASSSNGYELAKGSCSQASNLSCSSSTGSSSSSSGSISPCATMDTNISATEKSYVIALPLASSSSSSSPVVMSRPKQQISESPPPLPPPNRSSASGNNKAKKPDKNLRFSEHLENFEFESTSSEKLTSSSSRSNPSSKKYHQTSGASLNRNSDTVSQYSQAQLDTQSVTTEFIPEQHHQRSLSNETSTISHSHNYSSDHSFSNSNNNTILSCGHMKTCSNYSTLSSITSSLTDEETTARDPRSAIQQLRDLSMLIGGHFSPSSNSNSNDHNNSNNPKKSKSKLKLKLKSNTSGLLLKKSIGIKVSSDKDKKRRNSDGSTDSSSRDNSSGTDSGQCSGSGQSPTEDNSPKEGKIPNSSYPSSCAFGKGDCDDCFTVFKNPLAENSHSHSSSCSTGTSRVSPLLTTLPNEHQSGGGVGVGGGGGQQQNRCENLNGSHHHRHRHLIIQDQNQSQRARSRLRQSTGTSSSSGQYMSSSQGMTSSCSIPVQGQMSHHPSHNIDTPRNPLIYGTSSSLSHISNSHSSSSHGSKKSNKKTKKHKRSHDSLVLEYCDCSQCDCEARRGQPRQRGQEDQQLPKLLHATNSNQLTNNNNGSRRISNSTTSNNYMNSSSRNGKEVTNGNEVMIGNPNGSGGNSSSSNHTKRNPGNCHNNSSISSSHSQSLPPTTGPSANNAVAMNTMNNNNNSNNLFTIDEEDFGEHGDVPGSTKLLTDQNSNEIQGGRDEEDPSGFMNVTIKDFNSDEGEDHWHPKCWLATDATMGWSDLESLYSQNMKLDRPVSMNEECWTCWKELAENRPENRIDANRTVDRTKRMFIWLNRRHKEFNAPWWEAKKQASIRWLITKAFANLPKESIGDPFKESRKGKPKYRLKDEVIKGLVSGKLYCLTLDHLYENQHFRSGGLTHWDIIKILSRRGIYVAQPSDMKLTEGTLRQKKPLRIAAHIALIEAIMGLYCKETLNRDRIVATLNSLGQSVDPEISSAEQLLISWINATLLTLKSYIRSNKHLKLPCGRLNRWLNVPQVHEIRDLCDGVGICSLFALYCSNDLQLSEIAVPETDDVLNMYETIANHSIIQRLCQDLFPEMVYHLCITDFLYIHGYMKQNILCFLVDLFHHLEINPVIRVNRLTHLPIRIEL